MKQRNDTGRTTTTLIAAVLLLAAMIVPAKDAGEQANLTPAKAKAIAGELFYRGRHPVGIYHLRCNYAQNERSKPLIDGSYNLPGVVRVDRDGKKPLPLGASVSRDNLRGRYNATIFETSEQDRASRKHVAYLGT